MGNVGVHRLNHGGRGGGGNFGVRGVHRLKQDNPPISPLIRGAGVTGFTGVEEGKIGWTEERTLHRLNHGEHGGRGGGGNFGVRGVHRLKQDNPPISPLSGEQESKDSQDSGVFLSENCAL